ncbi:glycosyltransferase family 2 protein [Gonapodya prolifera JEL478]|uniref:Chitin synthase n=1 Tax=Gonapodya prolifera (strain JEL478) TaxID=1344416 RepID=A0A139AGU0_GONPJ|nr:glycosyltransferase family 2 protein [Gonapodya prolifera JEL478]|eukprot:KXS16007.1 glycosyltransferase family 2 protein [Gonapodya prolifera JEL478]
MATVGAGPATTAGGLAPPAATGGFARSKTKKSFALTPKGNLQVDVKVPPKLIEGSQLTGWETEYLRYTAPACDPNDFPKEGFTLRPKEHSTPRQIELAICCTMYNESPELFAKTWAGVVNNITYLMQKNKSETWGPESWKKIVVTIVSDGRAPANKQTLALLGLLGCYQEGVIVGEVPNKYPANDGSSDMAKVTAHIFEYTTQVMVDEDLKLQQTVPIQMIYVLKEQNGKKINSHRWFFNAICPILQPKICILIDVGTRPLNKAIYHLWRVFDRHPDVGGACGEIRAELGPWWKNALNPIVATQNFEYKISNILDKPLESAFGYISVLPGAFSAYRYAALQSNTRDKEGNPTGPLQAYFKGEALHNGKLQGSTFVNNMYLAEDRILCFELVSKKDEAWVLRYERFSGAETDVPDTIVDLIKQRRRWLNGSTFAALYSIYHWLDIFRSSHSMWRKGLFVFETFYNLLVQIFAWFGIANFYMTFFFVMQLNSCGSSDAEYENCGNTGAFSKAGRWLAEPLKSIYLVLLVTQFILSMGNRPDGAKKISLICTIAWCILNVLLIYMIFFGIAKAIIGVKAEIATVVPQMWLMNRSIYHKDANFRNIVVSMASTYGLWFLMSVAFLDPWHMFNSFIQYMILTPFYINMMQVYALCNTHDISWGTKGLEKEDHGLGVAKKQDAVGKKEEVTLEVPDENKKEEADRAYDKFYTEMIKSPEPTPEEKKKKAEAAAKDKADDDKKEFRTLLVLFWIVSNMFLVICLTSPGVLNAGVGTSYGNGVQYLGFLFFSTTFFAVVRAIGATVYCKLSCGFGVEHLTYRLATVLTQQLFDRKEDPDDVDVGNLVAQRPRFGRQQPEVAGKFGDV